MSERSTDEVTAEEPRAGTVIEPGAATHRQDVFNLLQTILKMAVEMMSADRGVVLLGNVDKFDENPTLDRLHAVASFNFPDERETVIKDMSSQAVAQVLETGSPFLLHDAQADPRFGQAASVVFHQITSIICSPMFLNERIVGAIYLDSRRNRRLFTQDNLNFIDAFARMAAIAVDYAVGYQEIYAEKLRLENEARKPWTFEEIVGKSDSMQEVFKLMRRVMNSDISVMLEGESGTGKEVVARALHYNGHRRDKPFVAQFCGNLAETLLESELFGHKKGSFTGAISDKRGLFEIADGGTFFLDEIADISPTIQTKLLRVVQEGEIRRVGDTESRKVNVRLISATNRSLKAEVDAGRFREDLYYRLNVISVRLPPLREREGDVPILAHHFLKHFCAKNKLPVKKLTPRALEELDNYTWPGNVRELENTIERAVILSQGDMIDVDDLFIPKTTGSDRVHKSLKENERELVFQTLHDFDDNKTRTAEVLGVSLRWLHYKLNEWKKSVA